MTKQDNHSDEPNDDSAESAPARPESRPDAVTQPSEVASDADGDAPGTADESAAPAQKATRPQTKSARTAGRRPGAASTPDTVSETEPATDADPAKPSSGREISLTFTTRGLTKVLAGIVVIAVVVGVVLLGWGYYHQRQELAAFDDSKSASEEFSVKLVSTMNTDNIGNMKELLGPLSTGEFRQHLEQQQSAGTKAVKDLNVKATPTVKSVSVTSFDTDSAKTSVLMEVSGTSSLAPSGGKELMLIWLDLHKEDGKWLVAKLDGAQAGIGAPQGEQNQSGQPAAPQTPQAPAPAPAPAG
ncbi:hypothetical protein GTV32_02440 [Gordonia sp. SID5947]|uniref:hypothetical protein n=1 Tax=Gordonia sp. SID5947 TaxID=2690315 RepID=UPI00136CD88C|nr:hypothetical protein [Gordonia sp. SID5947]MYR05249.1 hypothetical protein [Gordonia sp. SID5947]